MLFLRKSSNYLFIQPDNIETFRKKFETIFNVAPTSFYSAGEVAKENSSIVFLLENNIVKTSARDAKYVYYIEINSEVFLSELILKHLCREIKDIRFGPSVIILRYIENPDKVIELLKSTYKAKNMNIYDAIYEGELNDSIVFLSKKSLSKILRFKDTLQGVLLIKQPVNKLFTELNNNILMYIIRSLDKIKGMEYEIGLYDSEEKYEIHYQRFMLALSGIEGGFILSEGWSKDHPFVMLTVLIYKMKIFSFMKPDEFKEFLLGLEYDEDGNRIADFDLYLKGKKISWVDKVIKSKFKNRNEIGAFYRRKLYEKFNDYTIKKLREFERQLKNKDK